MDFFVQVVGMIAVVHILQKQSFVVVPENKCSLKFHKFRRKTPVLESRFNKVIVLQTCNFIKKRHQHAQVFSCGISEFFKNPSLTEHLRWLLLIMPYRFWYVQKRKS